MTKNKRKLSRAEAAAWQAVGFAVGLAALIGMSMATGGCVSVPQKDPCGIAHARYVAVAGGVELCNAAVRCTVTSEDVSRMKMAQAEMLVLCKEGA